MIELFANGGDPDQTSRSVASGLGLQFASYNAIYWKILISISGMSCYVINIFLEKNG